jgi:hypothetical protein
MSSPPKLTGWRSPNRSPASSVGTSGFSPRGGARTTYGSRRSVASTPRRSPTNVPNSGSITQPNTPKSPPKKPAPEKGKAAKKAKVTKKTSGPKKPRTRKVHVKDKSLNLHTRPRRSTKRPKSYKV